MQAGRAPGMWMLLTILVLHAARLGSAEEFSFKLDRLERLLMNQQAQLVELLAHVTKHRDQIAEQQAQIEWMKKENLKTAAVKVHEQDRRPSDHAGEDHQTETPVHNPRARSDDGGPLEVVVNRLAQDVTQLAGKLQAVSDNVQALSEKVQPLPGNLQTLSGDVQALQTSDAARGSTFIHWGSSTCSSSSSSSSSSPSQLVYSGVLGGSYYSSAGAAANALCLTMSPKLRDVPSGLSHFAALYGGEYETIVDSYYQKDPVCALCWSPLTSTLMVPATTECPAGWTRQYSGFLMAGANSQAAASEFVCVDTKRESRPGSGDSKNGYIWYYTKTVCGSLPCDPYVNNKLVTCVVCSK